MLSKLPLHADEHQRRVKDRDELIALYEENHCEVIWATNGKGVRLDYISAVRFLGYKASFNRNITQLGQWYLPEAGHLYPLLSGASHSEGWLLDGINPNNTGEALNSVVMPLFELSEGYIKAICAYFGIDEKPYMVSNRRRIMGLMMRGGAGKRKPDVSTSFGIRTQGLPHKFARRRPKADTVESELQKPTS